MSLYELLDQAVALLERRRRVTYRALKLELGIDDEELEAIKDELIYAQQSAVDEDGRVLVYTGADMGGSEPKGSAHATPITPTDSVAKRVNQRLRESPAILQGERKHVTVLFADIKSSTELIRSLDPEDAREILDPAVEVMIDVVHRYEGTVNQVLGDGIMALFGAPVAREDHAVRACYAALDMQAAMLRYSENLQDSQGVSVEIGVGLNSGEVVVRTIGNDLHMEYSAVGQTTNLASKIQAVAKPSTILISKDTARLVEGLMEVEPLDPVRVQGIREPIEAHELLDVTPESRRLQASLAQGLTRFVGREAEFTVLQNAIHEAEQGNGQVVAIVGEPGVGKSRLIYEFLSSDACDEWTVLQSSSVSYGKVRAYFPVIHLLRNYFDIADGLLPKKIAVIVEAKLAEPGEHLENAIPPVLALLDALPSDNPFHKLEPREQHRATLEALRLVFAHESQRRPLIVIFEDLHSIDNGTQTFLDSVVEMLPTSRMLLVANYRPEYRHEWGNKSYYTQIHLGHLSSQTAYAMLDVLLGNDPTVAGLKPLLVERTQGNPFFLEEMVRTIVETSILAGERGAYRVTRTPERLEIPSTVQAVLAARIDRLTQRQKELLQTAAVIGRNVPLPLLQAVAELEEADLQQELSNLIASEFIYEARLYPERAFTFKHALTNEVAYESLLREQRRSRHARIVMALEEFAGDHLDEHAERIAPHAMHGELWHKAVSYFWKAGTRSLSRPAYQEAVACFEQALEALERLPQDNESMTSGLDILVELRNARFPLEQLDQLLSDLQRAESLATRLNDQRRLVKISAYMVHYLWLVGDPEKGSVSGQRGLAVASKIGDLPLKIELHYRIGRCVYVLGNYRQALAHLDQSLETYTQFLAGDPSHRRFDMEGYPAVLAHVYSMLCAAELGDFALGFKHAEEARAIADLVNHPFSSNYVDFGLGVLHLRCGNVDNAISTLEHALARTHKADIPVQVPMIKCPLGYGYVLGDKVDAGIEMLEDSVVHTEGVRSGGQSLRISWLCEAYLLAGRFSEAREQAGQALAMAIKQKEKGRQAWILRLLGDIDARWDKGDLRTARASYGDALQLARKLEMKPLEARCLLALGVLHRKIGQSDAGRKKLELARDLYRSMSLPVWLAETESELEQLS